MKLLETLGITEEDLIKSKEKLEKEEELLKNFENQWKPWKDKYLDLAKGYIEIERLFSLLNNLSNDDILYIKPTKKSLNEIIKFSSSRHNEFKKSDYVQWCYEALRTPNKNLAIERHLATTGCFSAGAHGNSGKKGSPLFNAKFLNSGSYEFIIVFGIPFLILDNSLMILFKGFDYDKPEINEKIKDEYEDYISQKNILNPISF